MIFFKKYFLEFVVAAFRPGALQYFLLPKSFREWARPLILSRILKKRQAQEQQKQLEQIAEEEEGEITVHQNTQKSENLQLRKNLTVGI